MKSKIDKSLQEVWEMKEKAYQDFIKSGYTSYSEYIKIKTEDTIKKYNIQIRNKIEQHNPVV